MTLQLTTADALEANSCSRRWARESPLTNQNSKQIHVASNERGKIQLTNQNSKQIHVLCAKCGKDQWTNQNSKHIHAPCTKRMLPRYDWFWFSFWLVKKLLHKVLANHKRGIANQSYLHGPTSRLTVWANGKKDSGLVNFILKSCVLFAQICSFYRKTAAKVWNWYQRWALTNRTPTHPIGLPFHMFRCPRKFSTGTTRKSVFHLLRGFTFPSDFPEAFGKW